MIATNPNGVAIVGTLEVIPGMANTHHDSFERGPDGRITYEHMGETDVYWDGQETVERKGKTVFVDEDGGEWTEDQIMLVETEDA